MFFLLMACAGEGVIHDDADMNEPICNTQVVYRRQADALRELADMQELCATLDNPYTVSPCIAPAPAMAFGVMSSCESYQSAAEDLEDWLENTRLQFSAACKASEACMFDWKRQQVTRSHYRLSE